MVPAMNLPSSSHRLLHSLAPTIFSLETFNLECRIRVKLTYNRRNVILRIQVHGKAKHSHKSATSPYALDRHQRSPTRKWVLITAVSDN